ncbi:amiloride-sensitive sodium channel subunit gamma [Rousettus aegyptiacus]|uniref:Epithelial sodium channel subunit gamma n=1 Tax=Rousettus aegyptiacus TaxID=9407 RepID=A0A7J8F3J2_ROUAE|nr:amiloride-sensitive sodium channel subunit gamma [Rousettus aegyptiacus]XP_036081967.1 amiloride-sensitive sodium channel subunit gamma [Rousettus aegyptiacus]KAF6442206.1 sodium channel epithelial 1 subunit gamma [Rousettus aegyptiacus]
MAPGEKIKAKIKKNLPVTGPQAPTVRELMRWYCLNTNTHGCRRIVVSRGRLRRLLWILFTLTAVALIFWQCALLVLSFYTVSVSIKVHFQKLDFPAVTICNINPYKYSAVRPLLADLEQETWQTLKTLYGVSEIGSRTRREAEPPSSAWEDAQPQFLKLIPLLVFREGETGKATDFRTGRKRKVSGTIIHKAAADMVQESKEVVGFQLCSNDTSKCAVYTFSSGVNAIQEWYKLHYMNIMAQVPLEKKINMSYSAKELLVTCFFDGVSCDARNFTLFHHPMYGNCYTFNSKENEVVLSTSMGGSEYGLQVILYINEEEYNPFLVSSSGAKVIVHRQDEYPFIEDVGTEIETAMATSIGMHLTESFKLSQPYSQCTEDGSDVPVQNIYDTVYSLQICLHSCFQNKMVENCGCAQYSQPLPPGASYCNYQQHPNWMYCYYELHQAFVQERLGCQAVCREACSFKEWTLTTSLAQWPSVVSEKWLLRVLTWDQGQQIKQLNKTDLAKLLIFYKDLNQRSIMESPANSVEVLLSNFGGQLGLWLSCSVVCVIEIFEVFFIDSLSIVARRQWQRAKKWWAQRQAPPCPEVPAGPRGRDNPALDLDDDPPTFTSALRLPQALEAQVPGTPPPRYNTLRLERAFSTQLADTQVPAEP